MTDVPLSLGFHNSFWEVSFCLALEAQRTCLPPCSTQTQLFSGFSLHSLFSTVLLWHICTYVCVRVHVYAFLSSWGIFLAITSSSIFLFFLCQLFLLSYYMRVWTVQLVSFVFLCIFHSFLLFAELFSFKLPSLYWSSFLLSPICVKCNYCVPNFNCYIFQLSNFWLFLKIQFYHEVFTFLSINWT